MKREQRFDFGSIRSKPVKTSQGFLKLTGNLTRVGVLTYRKADGGEFRELRLPEEVFNADSLSSLAGAPVTDLHPLGLIDPSNVTKHQKGFVGESVKRDGCFVSAPLVVQDAGLIAAVESGERRELSPGYTCGVEHNPGTWEGAHYDAIQRGITYNHLAIGPKGWGRSGSEVALKLDGHSSAVQPAEGAIQIHTDGTILADFVKDALSLKQLSMRELASATNQDEFALAALLEGFSGGPITEKDLSGIATFLGEPSRKLFDLVPVADRGDGGTSRRKKMETVQITIDGISYDVPTTAGPHIVKAVQSRDTRITELQAKADAAEAKADAATKEAAETKVKLDAAEAPEKLAEAVTARVALVSKATKVLGAETKLDELADRDIKLRCIKHTDSAFSDEDKSDDYVNARFDLIKEDEKPADDKDIQERKDATAKALNESSNGGNGTPDESKLTPTERADAARVRMHDRNQKAWQQDLSATK